MSEQSLIACPFCGSEAQLDEHDGLTSSKHYTATVQCGTCEQVWGNQGWGRTRADANANAIAAWNSRHQLTPDRADGLSEDLHELIRVALTNPADLTGFIQANYPSLYANYVVEPTESPVGECDCDIFAYSDGTPYKRHRCGIQGEIPEHIKDEALEGKIVVNTSDSMLSTQQPIRDTLTLSPLECDATSSRLAGNASTRKDEGSDSCRRSVPPTSPATSQQPEEPRTEKASRAQECDAAFAASDQPDDSTETNADEAKFVFDHMYKAACLGKSWVEGIREGLAHLSTTERESVKLNQETKLELWVVSQFES